MLKKTTTSIKELLILGLAYLLISCGQKTENSEKPSTILSSNKDTNIESNSVDTTTKSKPDKNISPYQRELDKALADSTIDNYYKEIYRQEKLVSAEDNKMLSITENLFTNDPGKDLFYFIVFTKSMNGSDGFYSEAVGHSALKFITKKTEWFADYFNIAPKLTDKDMDNWAQYVYGEIQISRENQEKKAIKELENQLLNNIKGARKEYQFVIEQFVEKIKSISDRSEKPSARAGE